MIKKYCSFFIRLDIIKIKSYNYMKDKKLREISMKKLYMIGGTMGVGKSAVCQELKNKLNKAVFLDGDWCWNANPFQVTNETKKMVLQNITFLLNQFLHCSAYENIVFCWVMHEQFIIESILNALDTTNCQVKVISLICNEDTLLKHLQKDIENGIRTSDILERSIARIPLYQNLNTVKIAVDGKTIPQIEKEIEQL